jgi:hypothetical protein
VRGRLLNFCWSVAAVPVATVMAGAAGPEKSWTSPGSFSKRTLSTPSQSAPADLLATQATSGFKLHLLDLGPQEAVRVARTRERRKTH